MTSMSSVSIGLSISNLFRYVLVVVVAATTALSSSLDFGCHSGLCSAERTNFTVDPEKAPSLVQFRSKFRYKRVQHTAFETEGSKHLFYYEHEKADFLISATFGPTLASMDAMGSMSKSAWITDQMNLDPTLHRVRYRSRVNPHAGRCNKTMLPRGICDKGSRWMNFAFSRGDEGRKLKVENGTISVDGKFRTSLMQPGFAENGLNATTGAPWLDFSIDGYVCQVWGEAIGGKVLVHRELNKCDGPCWVCTELPNPAVWLLDPSLFTEPAQAFETGLKEGLLFLSEAAPGCSMGSFIKQSGKYYMHEPRMELLNNEVYSPSGGKYEKAFVMVSNNLTTRCNEWGKGLTGSGCRHAAEQLGMPFGGVFQWEGVPLKCLTDGTTVWHNNRWWGSKDIKGSKYHLICHKPCPVVAKNFLNKAGCRVESACGGTKDMVCGSPGEVANDPKQGLYYNYYQLDLPFVIKDNRREFDGRDQIGHPEGIIWANLALTAPDQLRQRVAWALAQIFVMSTNAFAREEKHSEMWVNYYDIFVRHAFGDFRDIVKEVTYSPMMMTYLTYGSSSAFDVSGFFYPDENYAREIMQLFTLGQWMLNMDGTEMKDEHGEPILVYDNDDIMNLARIFTGFRRRESRGNTEHVSGGQNYIDPAFINAGHHDVYPKPGLMDNFVGDRYPLCRDLPPQAFLRKGAVYEFLGHAYDGVYFLNVTEGSGLYDALKVPAVSIELAATVQCAGSLCAADTVKVVKVGDAFYKYARPTCVNLFFYHPRIIRDTSKWNSGGDCSHAYLQKAATACCDGDGVYVGEGYDVMERVTFPIATDRCNRLGFEVCLNDGPRAATERFQVWTAQECPGIISVDYTGKVAGQVNGKEKNNPFRGAWRGGEFPSPGACPAECQGIRIPVTSGNVTPPNKAVVNYVESPPGTSTGSVEWQLKCDADAEVQFAVDVLGREIVLEVAGQSKPWSGGPGKYWGWSTPSPHYTVSAGTHAVKLSPKNDNGLSVRALQLLQGSEVCRLLGYHDVKEDVCVCPMEVEDKPVFDGIPLPEDLLARLYIGAFPPDAFGQAPGSSETSGDVTAYMPSGSVDMSTTFAYQGRYYKNMESVVHVGASHAMRNPPAFMNHIAKDARDAHDEVDAFLDHLVAHPNVAPFIAYRLIQRFTTSNPTGSYVRAVAEAFVSGSYDGKEYAGNMGATIAAILLYPGWTGEAPASILENGGIGNSTKSADKPDLRQLGDLAPAAPAPTPPSDSMMLAQSATTNFVCGAQNQMVVNNPSESFRNYSSVGSRSESGLGADGWCAANEGNDWADIDPTSTVPTSLKNVEWMQLDLGEPRWLGGVATEGVSKVFVRKGRAWASRFEVSVALWEERFHRFAEFNDTKRQRGDVLERFEFSFAEPVRARFVRFTITEAVAWPCMRAAVLECPNQAVSLGDTRFGKLREPLLRILHYLRAMEYEQVEPRADVAISNLQNRLGQWPYSSETVFNFYKPEYSPGGFADGDVAPEFEIFDTNRALNFLNGMKNLVDMGLKHCGIGFGVNCPSRRNGYMKWSASESVEDSIYQLSTLLTGGRASQSFLRAVYAEAAEDEKMQAVQEAIVFSPEFNTQGASLPAGPRAAEQEEVSNPSGTLKPYKAIVKLYFGGGMDSFNMLVPMDCYLLDEYTLTRNNVALNPKSLHRIDANSSKQPCKTFGLHPSLRNLKTLYDSGDLAFAANIGGLVEPLTKEIWKAKTGRKCVGLYSHSNQMLGAQTMTCQMKTPRERGAGGRLADILGKTYRTASFSLNGNAAWSRGLTTPVGMLDPNKGVARLLDYEHLKHVIGNVTSVKHGNMYSEEYVKIMKKGVDFGEKVAGLLEDVALEGAWTGHDIGLKMVAKVIKTRVERQAERDIFFVMFNGWDHHDELTLSLQNKFTILDGAIAKFVKELKLMGVFDQVVLTTSSDFGRTLTSNGKGTDHGWAANHFMVGGALAGGKIYNKFPEHLAQGNDQDMGRGRMMPLYPLESVEHPVARWMGIQEQDVDYVYPNAKNFNASKHFIQLDELFPAQ